MSDTVVFLYLLGLVVQALWIMIGLFTAKDIFIQSVFQRMLIPGIMGAIDALHILYYSDPIVPMHTVHDGMLYPGKVL